ncbi:pyrroline-5-carboxylate reductase [Porticoccaceae bacterium]|jgi:pyrroline-5-carboxylate reductase|nr:pyrroline-5-carboxylate reductase [Porticoccaceae bacterium]MDA8902244.1 pyrroline-5-carboxylate reductase [Porticoccaceae bacterium]MDB2480151.1 pyrroline-5-carboxylate reductase [Porticoccaceae bacterium]MDB2549718.1 pyrroline-5-carboxylate reductase [Porticoccaceae bacterium]
MNSIAFIGGGNMASCIISGMVANDFDPRQILVGTPSQSTRDRLSAATGATTMADNHQAAARADIVVLAVKPKMMRQVVMDLASALTHRPIIISVAAGIPVAALKQWLGSDMPVIRAMPNTPSMIQAGATGLFTQSDLTTEQRSLVDQIFQAIGYSCWVDSEELIDAVIAVSGSGPAYFFLVLEAMQKIAQELGLPKQTAQELSLHTALGASRMAMESGISAAELRDQVTSPGGTTQAAIKSFQQHGLEDIFRTAMTSAVARAQEMSKDFSS